MKYYETSYEDYIQSVEKYNLHPYIEKKFSTMKELCNLIFYGATGIGKYSQVLNFLKSYSPSNLKYDKKITISTEKQNYTYQISDIHYEIDMQLLGCHSKLLWHEIFYQIVDIITMKSDKIGFIVCSNFHHIHNELLEIFYSYMQQYSNINSHIKIYFIIISENISFLPNNILNSCKIIGMKRPSKEMYSNILQDNNTICNPRENDYEDTFDKAMNFMKKSSNIINIKKNNKYMSVINNISPCDITNIKELKLFTDFSLDNIPQEVFICVCDSIIELMKSPKLSLNTLRDTIYDILIYNIDATECVWYILSHFIENKLLNKKGITNVLIKSDNIFLQYNNNYRPIYHLENILLYIIIQVNESKSSLRNITNKRKKSK
jgi:hypothetical protein